MATTTNFGFNTPNDTDLVKDGALAMRTLGNNIDARFGNVGTYPNQIVNVVGGVSRPVPYAMSTFRGTLTSGTAVAPGGTAQVTVTWATAGRFTSNPIATVSIVSIPGGSALFMPKLTSVSTSGFIFHAVNKALAASQLPPVGLAGPRKRTMSQRTRAPEIMRSEVKLPASMPVVLRARRQSSELAAKASMAMATNQKAVSMRPPSAAAAPRPWWAGPCRRCSCH